LIERRIDPRDRRAVGLYLTAAGADRATAVQSARAAPLRAMVATLTPVEAATLGAVVARLLAARVDGEAAGLLMCRLCDHDRCECCPAETALKA